MVTIKKEIILVGFVVMIISGCSALRTTPYSEVSAIQNFENIVDSDEELINLSFINEEDRFYIETIEIEEYDYLEEISPIISLIGYNDEYIYVLNIEGNSTIVSRVNYSEKFIEKEIYKCDDGMIFSFNLNEDYLYIGEVRIVEEELVSVLRRINLQDEYNLFSEEIVFQNKHNRFPSISYSDDYIIVNYVSEGSYILEYMTHDSSELVEIFKSDFSIEDGHLYTGLIPLYANGNKHGIYFQVITLNNEPLDFGGTQSLYYYSFEKDEYMQKLTLHDKITYVNSNEDIAIINYYSVDNPRVQTGKIISFKNNTIINIPGTSPVNSVNDSFINGDLLFITAVENIYMFDMEKKIFASMDIKISDRTEIKIFKDTFGFFDRSNETTAFSIIRLK